MDSTWTTIALRFIRIGALWCWVDTQHRERPLLRSALEAKSKAMDFYTFVALFASEIVVHNLDKIYLVDLAFRRPLIRGRCHSGFLNWRLWWSAIWMWFNQGEMSGVYAAYPARR